MSLQLYRERLALIAKQRAALDEDFAQVLAEGIVAGHRVVDLLDTPRPSAAQPSFDL